MRLLPFILIELLLYPFSMLGIVLFMAVIVFHNRRLGISGTAYEPLMNRVIYHELGMRADDAAARLASALPATRPLIWTLMMGPTRLAVRISDYRPSLFTYPPEGDPQLLDMMAVRTAFFDRTLNEALSTVAQVVILGAGWDTRAYGLPESWSGRIFEVDAPATQDEKRAALDRARIDAGHVTFVAVDFNTTDWLEALEARGFDRSLPTYLLWEGVTMYLEDQAISATWESVARLAPGSAIAFDFFAGELIHGERPYRVLGRLIPPMMKLTYGEKFLSGIPMQGDPEGHVRTRLTEHGLILAEFTAVRDIYGFALARV
jgi:methyltransferase (TIGR00027 family)